MSNGETLDSIEDILTGNEPIPANVSNRLVMAAIRTVYQKSFDNAETSKKNCTRLDEVEKTLGRYDERISNLSGRSNILDALTALGAAIGIGISVGK